MWSFFGPLFHSLWATYIHTYIALHCIALHYITYLLTYIHTYIHACMSDITHTPGTKRKSQGSKFKPSGNPSDKVASCGFYFWCWFQGLNTSTSFSVVLGPWFCNHIGHCCFVLDSPFLGDFGWPQGHSVVQWPLCHPMAQHNNNRGALCCKEWLDDHHCEQHSCPIPSQWTGSHNTLQPCRWGWKDTND